MTLTTTIITTSVAAVVLLGAIWRFVRSVTKNADAWDIVKKQLLANGGHSLVDRVGKIEERLERIESSAASIDRKVTP